MSFVVNLIGGFHFHTPPILINFSVVDNQKRKAALRHAPRHLGDASSECLLEILMQIVMLSVVVAARENVE